jgi:hypothetical protein
MAAQELKTLVKSDTNKLYLKQSLGTAVILEQLAKVLEKMLVAVLYWNKLAGIDVKEALEQYWNVDPKLAAPVQASNILAGMLVNAVQP